MIEARVGHRLALDHTNRVLSLVSLDVMPSQAAFDSMDLRFGICLVSLALDAATIPSA